MKDNQIWIKEMINDISDQIITKYENSNFPFRTVFIKMNYCYCCKSFKKKINYLAEDSFRGRFNLTGWLYCDDCSQIVKLAHKYCFLERNYLRYSETKFLINKDFNFWRISHNKDIKPYLEKKGYFDGSYNNLIYRKNNRIIANIVWKVNNDIFTKYINLSNLIYYNKFFFGNNINNTNFKNLEKKWTKLIKYEYDLVKSYIMIEKISQERCLSIDIENIIKLFIDNIY